MMLNAPADLQWVKNGITITGGHGRGDATNQLYFPEGLFVDDDQTITIADTSNHRIIQWKLGDKNRKVVAGGHGNGNLSFQLNQPTDVLIDKKTDSLIICDRGNRRVIRWSLYRDTNQGEILLNSIGCYGLAMDNKAYIYISDTDKNEVRRYKIGSKNSTLVAGGHGIGNGLNQLDYPTFVFVDNQQAVYVSDTRNHRVMKWDKDAKAGIVVAGGQEGGKDLTEVFYPEGLFVDTDDILYVVDANNDRVMRWYQEAKQDTVIVGGNGRGQQANQLNIPMGLSFDRHGDLYVVDWGNHRVQRFYRTDSLISTLL
ncbi:unnamed protein product [Rotaria sp. Silwood1]|nr:unnamed protein product [Rotaria sp. Silwood1]CAF1441936.1 unnamed protein product [Rotaria sp. Silwood1]CAF3547230.1 unnamed protein product [Rotaria sp. Silwood1]CAF3598438.1 unnamed protein product [Rotaria sp. Silwood1]CAF3615742.1 unnamed protein product [Rotaria sp. Silwood1]